jgi:hypothetical protein
MWFILVLNVRTGWLDPIFDIVFRIFGSRSKK